MSKKPNQTEIRSALRRFLNLLEQTDIPETPKISLGNGIIWHLVFVRRSKLGILYNGTGASKVIFPNTESFSTGEFQGFLATLNSIEES